MVHITTPAWNRSRITLVRMESEKKSRILLARLDEDDRFGILLVVFENIYLEKIVQKVIFLHFFLF